MDFQNLILEEREPGLWMLTLNRPTALNALNRATLGELAQAVRAIRELPARQACSSSRAPAKRPSSRGPISVSSPRSRRWRRRRWPNRRATPSGRAGAVADSDGGAGERVRPGRRMRARNELRHDPRVGPRDIRAAGNQHRHHAGIRRHTAPAASGRPRPRTRVTLTGRQVKAEEAMTIGLVNYVYPAAELLERGLELGRSLLASRSCRSSW